MDVTAMNTAPAPAGANGEELASPRLYGIAETIRGTAMPVLDADAGRNTARTLTLDASQKAAGLRMEVMTALAKLAEADDWTEEEITRAAAIAVGQLNEASTRKTLSTFIGECKHAMHVGVRAHVSDLRALCEHVWLAEAEQPKDARPAHTAFRRLYHMVIASFRLAHGKDGVDGMVLASVADTSAWAELNDPNRRSGAVFGKLQRMRAAVDHFAKEFPLDGLKRISAILDEIEERDLRRASERRGFRASETTTTRRTPLRQRTGLERQRVEPAEAPEQLMPEQLESIIDEVLGPAE